MSAEDSDKFKIRIHDDEDDVPEEKVEVEEDLDELPQRKPRRAEPDPLEKLSRRVTLTAALLFGLIAVLAVAGFYQIQKLLESSMMASTTAVSDMYREVENQMNALSENIASVDAKIGTEIAGVQKSIKPLEGLKPALDKVKASSVSKKEYEKDLTEIKNQMAAVKTLVDRFQAEIKTGNEGLRNRMEAMAAAVNTREKTLNSLEKTANALEIRQTRLENEKIGLAELRDAIQKQEDEFNITNGQFRKELNSLRAELVRLISQGQAGGVAPKSQTGAGVIEQNIE